MVAGPANAASMSARPQTSLQGAGAAAQMPALPPAAAAACGAAKALQARCGAIQLLDPAQNWHPGPAGHGKGGGGSGGGGGSTTPQSPAYGYYPGDLQSAYGLTAAAASITPGPSAPTVAIVDAYDDPNALSDLATYRASLSGTTDPSTGLLDPTMPPICGSGVTTGCVTVRKVNQSGGTSLPSANSSWAEEISLDLDMVSAICPDCNIVLVEASSATYSSLEAAVSYAKSLDPAAITNSYGGSEFSTETSGNSAYSGTATTAVTAAAGDSGYGVDYPAASPGVTAVGGTSLTYTQTTTGLSWDPQTVWSSSGSGCSAYQAIPSWQSDQSVYSLSADCTGRQSADVSAVANPSTGVATYDSYGQSGWLVFGGTSVSAQIIGAMYGVAAGSGPIKANPGALYVDSSGGTGPTPGLVPVTGGSNGSCGDYLCDASDFLSSGYNGPAGLGTPYGIGAFVTSSSTSSSFGLAVTPATQSVSQGVQVSYAVSVLPSAGFSGDVTLSATGVPSGASVTFSADPVSSSSSPAWASTMNVLTSASTPVGSYSLVITGTSSGAPTQTIDVGLTVQAPQTTGTMIVSVSAGQVMTRGKNFVVPLTVSASDSSSGQMLSGASVSYQVFAGSSCSGNPTSTGSATTGNNGQASYNFHSHNVGTWCALVTVADAGYSNSTGSTTFPT